MPATGVAHIRVFDLMILDKDGEDHVKMTNDIESRRRGIFYKQ
jgi:hypothetical protein